MSEPLTEPPITIHLPRELGDKLRAVMAARVTTAKSQMLKTLILEAWQDLPTQKLPASQAV